MFNNNNLYINKLAFMYILFIAFVTYHKYRIGNIGGITMYTESKYQT